MVYQHSLDAAVPQEGYINPVSPVGPPIHPVSNGLPSPTIVDNSAVAVAGTSGISSHLNTIYGEDNNRKYELKGSQMVYQHGLDIAVPQEGYINPVSPIGPPIHPVSNGLLSPTIADDNSGVAVAGTSGISSHLNTIYGEDNNRVYQLKDSQMFYQHVLDAAVPQQGSIYPVSSVGPPINPVSNSLLSLATIASNSGVVVAGTSGISSHLNTIYGEDNNKVYQLKGSQMVYQLALDSAVPQESYINRVSPVGLPINLVSNGLPSLTVADKPAMAVAGTSSHLNNIYGEDNNRKYQLKGSQMVYQHDLTAAVPQQGYINPVSPVGPFQLRPICPVSNGLPSSTVAANSAMAVARTSRISAHLSKIYGEDINRKYELKGSQIIIGRSSSADIILQNIFISRRHCILTYTDEGWRVKDNGSSSGTWICGQKLQPNESRLLKCGDIIFLGPPSEIPEAFTYDCNFEVLEYSREHLDKNPTLTHGDPPRAVTQPTNELQAEVITIMSDSETDEPPQNGCEHPEKTAEPRTENKISLISPATTSTIPATGNSIGVTRIFTSHNIKPEGKSLASFTTASDKVPVTTTILPKTSLVLKTPVSYSSSSAGTRPTVITFGGQVVRPSIVQNPTTPTAPVRKQIQFIQSSNGEQTPTTPTASVRKQIQLIKGSNGQLQVKCLLPGQFLIRQSDGRLKLIMLPTVQQTQTKQAAVHPAQAGLAFQLPTLRPAISLAPTLSATTAAVPILTSAAPTTPMSISMAAVANIAFPSTVQLVQGQTAQIKVTLSNPGTSESSQKSRGCPKRAAKPSENKDSSDEPKAKKGRGRPKGTNNTKSEFHKTCEAEFEKKAECQSLLELEYMDLVSNVEKFKCPVCFSDVEVGEGVTLHECLHSFCKKCLSEAIQFSKTAVVKCPFRNDEYSCESDLQEREVKSLVSPEAYECHLQRSIALAESQAQNSFHCKTPDCPGWCLFEDDVNVFICPVCKHTNCLICAAIHEGKNCMQYQEDLAFLCDSNEEARKTEENPQSDFNKPWEAEFEKKDNYQTLLELENVKLVSNAEKFECPVCFSDVEVGEGATLQECLHNFCKECLADAIKFSETALVTCPFRNDEYSCESHLQEREVKSLVSPEVYERHLQRSMALAESQAQNSFHCKTPDCPGWCLFEDDVNIFFCPVCMHSNCLTCAAIHEGKNCKQYQDDLAFLCDTNEEARKTKKYLLNMLDNKEAMRCPRCQVILMKKDGCDWLVCSMCRTEICWVTKGPRWGPGGRGDTSGGCRCMVNLSRCHAKCRNCH